MFSKIKIATFGLFCGAILDAQAANVSQISRYATVENKPLAAQINPLDAVQLIHFPQDVQTIGQALNYWLKYSGFHLAPDDKLSSNLKLVLKQPLPQVHRHLGPLTVKDGLEVLVGKPIFTLLSNLLIREVNFKLRLNSQQIRQAQRRAL